MEVKRNRITFKLTKNQSAKVKELAMKASGECYFVLAQLRVTEDISSLSDDAVIVNAALFEDTDARSVYEVITNLVKEEKAISQEG
jgi:hypothetical protein